VFVTVTEVNNPPVANDDSGAGLTTNEDVPLTIPFSRLLANDTVSDPADPFEADPVDPSFLSADAHDHQRRECLGRSPGSNQWHTT
jgi:hypothetical protein